ncbi:cytochrome c oxidase subunit III [Gammaproteobacteria bacterium]
MASMQPGSSQYFIPEPSPWPIIAMLSVFTILLGVALVVNGIGGGSFVLLGGLLLFAYLLFSWFGDVVKENLAGNYNKQVDRSFRQGMLWFIASEVFFFASFFGSLFYIRAIALPWLSGEGYLGATKMLYSQFVSHWPTSGPGQLGGEFHPMEAWGIPSINTLILLSSGATITWAHWGLKIEKHSQLVMGLIATVALGLLFVCLQAFEYHHAYEEMNLTLRSGVYGSTFYMLTGFHGLHVTIGAIMLMAILGRAVKGHFNIHNHFAFEAVAWYWHFVDVVWLGLFVFVYWM